jgi:hypothetical protein
MNGKKDKLNYGTSDGEFVGDGNMRHLDILSHRLGGIISMTALLYCMITSKTQRN